MDIRDQRHGQVTFLSRKDFPAFCINLHKFISTLTFPCFTDPCCFWGRGCYCHWYSHRLRFCVLLLSLTDCRSVATQNLPIWS